MQIIKVPPFPESVTEATVAKWHKDVGDSCNVGDHLVDLETDKVVLEVTAMQSGILEKIIVEEGTSVVAEQELGILAAATEEQQPVETSKIDIEPPSSPSVRREAKTKDLDLNTVIPSGEKGRILKEDLSSKVETTSMSTSNNREVVLKPLSRLRKTIADRLLSAQSSAAILSTFNEIDMHNVMRVRSEYKDLFQDKHGVKLGFMSFFTKAVTMALMEYPEINAYIIDDQIQYHNYADIGVAVSTDKGLIVPILRNAEAMSLKDIEANIADFATKAKDNKISLDELTGGTFTITNGGVFGSLLSTPILNPPQSGILGLHKIEKRPVAIDNQVVIRPMMYVTLSYDHRIVDGKEAVGFLVAVKNYLEDPVRLLMNI